MGKEEAAARPGAGWSGCLPYVGQGVRARVPENSGGTTRGKQGCLGLQRVPSSRLECGSGKKKPAVQGAGFLDGQDRA